MPQSTTTGSSTYIMSSSNFNSSGRSSPRFGRRARVLCDYEARSPDELDLTSDEIINVRDPGDGNSEYYLGEKGILKGRVPRAFLEVLDE